MTSGTGFVALQMTGFGRADEAANQSAEMHCEDQGKVGLGLADRLHPSWRVQMPLQVTASSRSLRTGRGDCRIRQTRQSWQTARTACCRHGASQSPGGVEVDIASSKAKRHPSQLSIAHFTIGANRQAALADDFSASDTMPFQSTPTSARPAPQNSCHYQTAAAMK